MQCPKIYEDIQKHVAQFPLQHVIGASVVTGLIVYLAMRCSPKATP